MSDLTTVTVVDTFLGSTTLSQMKTNVGLGNVDNTSDVDKPVSNAVSDALDEKEDLPDIHSGSSSLTFTDQRQIISVTISSDTVFTGSNYVEGREIRCIVIGDSVTRTLTFPTGWKFLGSQPSDIEANKIAVLSLYCRSNTESGVIACYAVNGGTSSVVTDATVAGNLFLYENFH